MTHTIVVPDFQFADDAKLERGVAGARVRWKVYRERKADRIPAAAWAASDAILCWHEMPMGADTIRRLIRCRQIVRCGVGFDHVDLEAAGAAGIPVCNVPDYGTSEVADHAIALLLAFTRGIVAAHNALKADPVRGWDYRTSPTTRRMRGSRFGIVGLGRIGTATALRAKAFGYEVLAYDPYLSNGQEIAVGVLRLSSLNELLSASDVVSLHAPLTPETRGMIGRAQLRRMKRGSILINTSRGPVIDTDALAEALQNEWIDAAGIDVLPEEPPTSGGRLVEAYCKNLPWTRNRLILTPHSAWSSAASQADARTKAVETCLDYLGHDRLRNCVNAEFLSSPRKLAKGRGRG
ncbi:MAG: C-terminal binding protein [Alphaproteobacteria bacterium]|nr:C-terminal binding protein [Alphaproteobacteria bacterium]